jgi:hypothetical protein
VIEYLEGETLAIRFKKGPLPLDQALRYAIQITDALWPSSSLVRIVSATFTLRAASLIREGLQPLRDGLGARSPVPSESSIIRS